MPHYYFNLCDRSGNTEDHEGCDLPDPAAARRVAVKEIRAVLSHEVLTGAISLDGRIEVRDDDGALVMTVPFADALTVSGRP